MLTGGWRGESQQKYRPVAAIQSDTRPGPVRFDNIRPASVRGLWLLIVGPPLETVKVPRICLNWVSTESRLKNPENVDYRTKHHIASTKVQKPLN